MDWANRQEQETSFWGTCQNTYNEETKQLVYAQKMGLEIGPFYYIDVAGKSILDVGGGPVSLLLKCTNLGRGKVIDPLSPPQWVIDRYKMAKIGYVIGCGETMNEYGWDEVWMYNVLTHVYNPLELLNRIYKAGRVIRVFEWVHEDKSIDMVHGKALSIAQLNTCLNGEGTVEFLNECGCTGTAYYGTFKG